MVRYSVRLIAQVAGNRDIVLGMRESVAGLLREYGANQQKLQQQRMGRMAAFAPAKGTAAAAGDGTTLPASLLPEVLLMYRDGLSDSQFDTALAVEYDAIKQVRAYGTGHMEYGRVRSVLTGCVGCIQQSCFASAYTVTQDAQMAPWHFLGALTGAASLPICANL